MSDIEYVDIDNDGVVDWWETRRAWGFIVGMIGMLASFAHVDIDQTQILNIISSLLTTVGMIVAFIGGINAHNPISKTSILPGIDIAKKSDTQDSRKSVTRPGKAEVDKALGQFSE